HNLLFLIELIPRGHALIALSERGALGNEAHFDLSAQAVDTGAVPALGKDVDVLGDVLPRSSERSERTGERKLQEERGPGPERGMVREEADGTVCEVRTQVVALALWHGNRVIVFVQLGLVLVSAPIQEPVIPVETTS